MKAEKGRKIAIIAGVAVVAIAAILAWGSWREIRAWYLLSTRFERLAVNEQGYQEYRHTRTGIVFVRLPGRTFWMGSPVTEKGRFQFESLPHEVALSPFLIAKCEVTEKQWTAVLGSPPTDRASLQGSDFPVHGLSWDDAEWFCETVGLLLPSGAQWEYACRAGNRGRFSGTGRLVDMAWYKENSGGEPHEVGRKEPNAFGLHDMHGNVHEWCGDFFDPDFDATPRAQLIDPVFTTGTQRLLRGGGCDSEPRYCRSAYILGEGTGRYTYVGFRPGFNLY